jgi:DNA polymerase-3 subunit epsilon
MLILGLDFESDHFDPETTKVTELGLVLWDTELKQPVEIYSSLVKEVGREPLSKKIVEITGITDSMIERYGRSPFEVIDSFLKMYAKADFVLAHNGNNFDRPLMRNFLGRYLSEGEKKLLSPKEWIDSLTDVDYPEICSHKNMTYLQGFYKVVNPFAHRAVTDVLTMLTIFDKNFDWQEMIDISRSPTMRFTAQVDYHNRDVAKDAGFKWDSVKRIWFKDMKKIFVERKNISFDFKHTIEELVK